MNRYSLIVFAAVLGGSCAVQAQTNPLSSELKMSYKGVQTNILKAAEKMPDGDYSFKATPDVRTFGQLIGHVADAQIGICSSAMGSPKRGDAAQKTSKADLVAALKASNEVCDSAYDGLTDATATEKVKVFGADRSKLSALDLNVAHDNEMYGYMSVYMRLKGVVPPSSEKK